MPVQRTPWNRSFDQPHPEPGAHTAPAGPVPVGPTDPVAPSSPLEPRPAGTRAATPAATPPTTPAVTPRVASAPLLPARHSRAGAAWVSIAVGVLLMVLLVVFLLQNTAPVEVAFFGMRGTAPLAVTLLIAGIGFALVTLVVGSTRIGQLRRRVSAGDRARRAAEPPAARL